MPRGSNAGTFVLTLLAFVGIHEPAAWCMAFACWIVAQLAKINQLKITGSCQDQVNHAKAHGTCVSADDVASGCVTLRAGWLMCVWEFADGWWHYCHTGVVETVYEDGSFTTIEGNTNADGGRQGYAVMRHTRHLHDTAGDGHAKYCFVMTL